MVLVTHDMATVQGFCDRALVLHDGELQYIGDPEEAILRYYRLNFGERAAGPEGGAGAVVVDAWLEDQEGERIDRVEKSQPLRFHALVEAGRELVDPVFSFTVVNVRLKSLMMVSASLTFLTSGTAVGLAFAHTA